ncbi:efflux transporter periplasmic adaptor subunit [Veronia nyctiphanis]|uniref:Efflux transporter periplasmic adaptor subunit n=1 Tax=Veronia nyctiphanis TaxID=1278244 RepID=A0A4Q0YYZ0_9GAMM|nr:efflux RND transporter periplasmic adaptor subunit [Veronia nyctiphanis]RXJ74439.1 efflux transporter periplasmic adaptor subunit [Veronia nyctiphanis]
MRKSTLALLISLLCGFILTGCEEQQQSYTKPLQTVGVMTVGKAHESASSNEFPAVAAAADLTALSFLVSGEVAKVFVKPGELVKKGQVLVALNKKDLRLAVKETKTSYELASRQYDRARKLRGTGALPKSQVDELKANRDVAKADYNLAVLKLSFAELKAPFAGVVSTVQVEDFENISPGKAVLSMHDANRVDVRLKVADQLYVNQQDISPEDVMKNINPRVLMPDGKEYPLSLREFTGEPDKTSGAFIVTMSMPMPKDTVILDGMSLNIITNPLNVSLAASVGDDIPLSAVFNGDGDSLANDQTYVWVLSDDNRVSKRQVVLEALSVRGVRVVGGLKPGERIVVKGVNKLMNGQEVRVTEGNKA